MQNRTHYVQYRENLLSESWEIFQYRRAGTPRRFARNLTTGACTLLITLERLRFENKNLGLNFTKTRTPEKVLQLNRINCTHLEHDNFKDFVYIFLHTIALRMNTIKKKNLDCLSYARARARARASLVLREK